MSLTPNYSFIIPTGSDAVNLLTQCYPNFTSLDSILKPIQESGVTVATDTKVGTVHQLVRTDSSCNMFRFIATGNYASGDTFTVDGTPVTATAMDGTALSGGAFVINQSVVCVLNNLVLTVLVSGKETTSLPASSITYDNTGSGLVATNAQDAIDELQSEIASIPTPAPDHGIYELWKNSNIETDFTAQTVTINDFDSTKVDAIVIVCEQVAGETAGAIWTEYDKDVLSFVSPNLNLRQMSVNAISGYVIDLQRPVAFTLAGTTLSIAFSACTLRRLTTYGVAPSSETSNGFLVPVRILALVHNS